MRSRCSRIAASVEAENADLKRRLDEAELAEPKP